MKKEAVIILLLGILLISPFILAEEQSQTSLQTYSNFNRFIDNVRMFFSFGNEAKVGLALAIREKEVNSALANIKENNKEEVNKNLENAFSKLIIVQEKVSPKVADEVANSVDKIVNEIEESNLTAQLNRYVLEEKKTQLVAKLVVEVEGKEGQTSTREVVKNGTEGRKIVNVVVKGENGEEKIIEIEGEIGKINNQIAEHTYAGGKGVIVQGSSGGKSGVVVEGDNNGVKNSGNETLKDEPLPTPDLHKINPDLYDPNARAPGDTIDETYDDAEINNGNCGDGVVCSGENNVIEGTTANGANNLAP
jgi:hypothetical protein